MNFCPINGADLVIDNFAIDFLRQLFHKGFVLMLNDAAN